MIIFKEMKLMVSIIRKSPTSVIYQKDYHSLRNYLEGLLNGLSCGYSGTHLNIEVSEWLMQKLRRRFSVFWTRYAKIMVNEDEEKAYDLLLDILEEFTDFKLSQVEEQE